ncbi:MAG: helix-turn-helix domain-containing protein [Acidobacteria bacterium]|nr:helix-turn-helix domain-containing protein [Acidobacteriota bacterium]
MMNPQDETKFLTVAECAELLRVSPKTIYAMVSEARIPFRKVGARVVFLYSEILTWTQPEKDRRSKKARGE